MDGADGETLKQSLSSGFVGKYMAQILASASCIRLYKRHRYGITGRSVCECHGEELIACFAFGIRSRGASQDPPVGHPGPPDPRAQETATPGICCESRRWFPLCCAAKEATFSYKTDGEVVSALETKAAAVTGAQGPAGCRGCPWSRSQSSHQANS